MPNPREQSQLAGDQFVQTLYQLPITLIPVTLQTILTAARYKSHGGLSYAYCFVLALAKEKNGTVVTGDPEFKRFEKEFAIQWLVQK